MIDLPSFCPIFYLTLSPCRSLTTYVVKTMCSIAPGTCTSPPPQADLLTMSPPSRRANWQVTGLTNLRRSCSGGEEEERAHGSQHVARYPPLAHAPSRLPRRTQAAVVPMASWLLLPFSSFPWPAPPHPDSSSCRGSGSDGGGDNGYWRPTVVAAFAGVQVGRALRRRFADLLRSPVPCLASPHLPFGCNLGCIP
jgi:hypothetical protein